MWCSPWDHKELDMTERLNCTELNLFWVKLCCSVRQWFSFFISHVDIQFPNIICWRYGSFPIMWSWYPCWRLLDHICKDLFLVSILLHWSLSINVFIPKPYHFDYHSFFLYVLKAGSVRLPSLFSFLKIVLITWIFQPTIWILDFFLFI